MREKSGSYVSSNSNNSPDGHCWYRASFGVRVRLFRLTGFEVCARVFPGPSAGHSLENATPPVSDEDDQSRDHLSTAIADACSSKRAHTKIQEKTAAGSSQVSDFRHVNAFSGCDIYLILFLFASSSMHLQSVMVFYSCRFSPHSRQDIYGACAETCSTSLHNSFGMIVHIRRA